MLNQLRKLVEETNTRVLGQVLSAKINKKLYDWVFLETAVLNNPTIKERIQYLILGKPNLLCANGKTQKFSAARSEYGFCDNIKNCQCFRDKMAEFGKTVDIGNIVEKRKKTWLKKYGYENASQSQTVIDKRAATMKERDYTKIYAKMQHDKETIGFDQVVARLTGIVEPCFTRAEYTGCFRKNVYRWRCVQCNTEFENHIDYGTEPRCPTCFPTSKSIGEQEVKDWIKSLGIDINENDRTILDGLELDILIPAKQLAVEFNGCYWHSDKFKDSKYHVTKYLQCKEKGIHLIQIFEDEWVSKKEIVKSRLLSALGLGNRVYARKCQVRKINPKEYRQFVIENHLQGYASASVLFGLIFEDKIIAAMSFSDTRYSDEGYELVRYCSVGNIVGGASKLFSAFVKEVNPTVIISYANRCWSNGNLYHRLGFSDVTKEEDNTGFWYVKNNKRSHRSTFNKQRLVRLGFDATKTANQIMQEEGFLKIYDCGNYKFRWESKG